MLRTGFVSTVDQKDHAITQVPHGKRSHARPRRCAAICLLRAIDYGAMTHRAPAVWRLGLRRSSLAVEMRHLSLELEDCAEGLARLRGEARET